nr:hypothetical protein [Tanacetum cinerariifolium]
MTLTFAETHNMIAYLTKSDASEGFNQIIDFLNGSSIKYALTVNPNIYVSCIKQFWTSVAVKKFNDVMRLQALVDKKGKGFSGVDTPLFEGMLVAQEVGEDADEVHAEGVNAAGVVLKHDDDVADEGADRVVVDDIPTVVDKPYIPSPTPTTQPPPPSQDLPSTSQVIPTLPPSPIDQPPSRRNKASKLKRLKQVGTTQRIDTSDDTVMDDVSKQERMIADMDADVDVSLKDVKDVAVEKSADVEDNADIQGRKAESQAEIYKIDLEHTKKIITEVVTTASDTITAASTTITAADVPIPAAIIAAAPTLTAAPSRRRKGVVIRDPQETAPTSSTIIHSEAKSKDKGKGILVEEPKPLKKQA